MYLGEGREEVKERNMNIQRFSEEDGQG